MRETCSYCGLLTWAWPSPIGRSLHSGLDTHTQMTHMCVSVKYGNYVFIPHNNQSKKNRFKPWRTCKCQLRQVLRVHYKASRRMAWSSTVWSFDPWRYSKVLYTYLRQFPSSPLQRIGLSKRDIQNFHKRLRIFIQRNHLDIKFKYFCVSEYGPTTLRPHYHIMYFVYGKHHMRFNKNLLSMKWQNGFISLSLARHNQKTASYVANYVAINKQSPYVEKYSADDSSTLFRTSTFYCWSRSLGKTYFKEKVIGRVTKNIEALKNSNPNFQKLINILHIGKICV